MLRISKHSSANTTFIEVELKLHDMCAGVAEKIEKNKKKFLSLTYLTFVMLSFYSLKVKFKYNEYFYS